MQQIINDLLYDTNTSIVIHAEEDKKRILYKTLNGNFFMLYANGEIIPKSETITKEYLGKNNVEKYIELFGNPKEA